MSILYFIVLFIIIDIICGLITNSWRQENAREFLYNQRQHKLRALGYDSTYNIPDAELDAEYRNFMSVI